MFKSFALPAALLILAPPLHALNPTLQARLTASDGGSRDWFGTSVSISGDTAVVGAEQSGLEPDGCDRFMDSERSRIGNRFLIGVRRHVSHVEYRGTDDRVLGDERRGADDHRVGNGQAR